MIESIKSGNQKIQIIRIGDHLRINDGNKKETSNQIMSIM